MHSALVEELQNVCTNDGNSKDNCGEVWRRAFTKCFLKVDDEVGGKAPDTVGSTAVVAIVCSSHIIVANSGDSRAVLCRSKQPIALSVDHKVRLFLSSIYLTVLVCHLDEQKHFFYLMYVSPMC